MIERACNLPARQGYERPHPRHLLLSLLEDSKVVDLLHGLAAGADQIRKEVLKSLQRTGAPPLDRVRFSGVGIAALLSAAAEHLPRNEAGGDSVDAEHLLLGLVRRDPQSAWILTRFGADYQRLRSAVEAGFSPGPAAAPRAAAD